MSTSSKIQVSFSHPFVFSYSRSLSTMWILALPLMLSLFTLSQSTSVSVQCSDSSLPPYLSMTNISSSCSCEFTVKYRSSFGDQGSQTTSAYEGSGDCEVSVGDSGRGSAPPPPPEELCRGTDTDNDAPLDNVVLYPAGDYTFCLHNSANVELACGVSF